jgi:hypothetical protein
MPEYSYDIYRIIQSKKRKGKNNVNFLAFTGFTQNSTRFRAEKAGGLENPPKPPAFPLRGCL